MRKPEPTSCFPCEPLPPVLFCLVRVLSPPFPLLPQKSDSSLFLRVLCFAPAALFLAFFLPSRAPLPARPSHRPSSFSLSSAFFFRMALSRHLFFSSACRWILAPGRFEFTKFWTSMSFENLRFFRLLPSSHS